MQLEDLNGNTRQLRFPFFRIRRRRKAKAYGTFAPPESLEELGYVHAAINTDTSENEVASFFGNRFDRYSKSKTALTEAALKTASEECSRFESLYKRALETEENTALFLPDRDYPSGFPSGWQAVAFTGATVLALLEIGSNGVSIANYALPHTNDWIKAFVIVLPILTAPLVLKFILRELRGRLRRIVCWGLTALGFLSFGSFIYSFANLYAKPEAGSALFADAGPGPDYRLLLASQLGLGLTVGIGLLLWIRSTLATSSDRMVNAAAGTVSEELQRIFGKLEAARRKLSKAEKEITSYQSSRSEYVTKWLTIYRALRKDRAKTPSYLSLLNLEQSDR